MVTSYAALRVDFVTASPYEKGSRMASPEEFGLGRRRRPSRLALQLTDAFAVFDEWTEVKVVRNEFGGRDKVIAHIRPRGSGPEPYDWSQAA